MLESLASVMLYLNLFFFLNIPTDCLTLSLSVSLSYYSCDV